MSSIFPGSASVGQIFEGYLFNGTAWDLIGNEFNPTTFSPNAPDNPKAGDLWVDSDSNVDILNDTNLASISDLDSYLTIQSASSTYATKTELDNIDLSSASAAAVTAIVDSAPETLNTLNELAAALGDDENFATTVTTSLSNKLDISSASTTYLSKNEASSTYLTSASMETVPVYVMNSGSSAQRPVSPSAGMFRFNTTTNYPEWYDASTSAWLNFYQQRPVIVQYLVIAGGGGSMGGASSGASSGGGGAGGYRNSTSGELSGANSTAETPLTLLATAEYAVTIAAGGAVGGAGGPFVASNSQFASVISLGGGGGGGGGWGGRTGGSGGGGEGAGSGTALQGSNGFTSRGGGGGAGAAASGVTGGAGLSSSITGTAVTRAGGGGGYNGGAGGAGGGGNGGSTGVAGTINTGGGAGGSGGGAGQLGGSGIVIIRYSNAFTITIGAGLTGTTSTVGSDKVTTFTAGTGTVIFN